MVETTAAQKRDHLIGDISRPQHREMRDLEHDVIGRAGQSRLCDRDRAVDEASGSGPTRRPRPRARSPAMTPRSRCTVPRSLRAPPRWPGPWPRPSRCLPARHRRNRLTAETLPRERRSETDDPADALRYRSRSIILQYDDTAETVADEMHGIARNRRDVLGQRSGAAIDIVDDAFDSGTAAAAKPARASLRRSSAKLAARHVQAVRYDDGRSSTDYETGDSQAERNCSRACAIRPRGRALDRSIEIEPLVATACSPGLSVTSQTAGQLEIKPVLEVFFHVRRVAVAPLGRDGESAVPRAHRRGRPRRARSPREPRAQRHQPAASSQRRLPVTDCQKPRGSTRSSTRH